MYSALKAIFLKKVELARCGVHTFSLSPLEAEPASSLEQVAFYDSENYIEEE